MMQVTYTNRKNKTYYLCQGVTKTGKPRYYLATSPQNEPVTQIPEGYEIRESVNGVVSLAKKRPVQILPEERAAVEAAIKRHPQSEDYRIEVKDKRIVIYERTGAGIDTLSQLFRAMGGISSAAMKDLQSFLDETAHYAPVMRFTLLDKGKRTFCTERWCYLGSIDDWIDIGPQGPVRLLARRFICLLGTDALFDEIF